MIIRRYSAAAVAVVAVFLFISILPNTFIWDDWQQIFENSLLQSPDGIIKIFSTNVWGFQGQLSNYYRPLMHLTFYVALRWFGFNPAGYHLISIALHALVSVCVFFLILRWGDDRRIALLAALLFAAHPIHTENVCWISAYPDLQASLFILLACLLYTMPRQSEWRIVIPAGLAACFFLGLLAKEIAIAVPPICLAWEYFHRRTGFFAATRDILRERWGEYLAMTLALSTYLSLRVWALGGLSPYVQTHKMPPGTVFYTRVSLVYRYLELLVWPMTLTAFHKFPFSEHWWEWRVLAGFACAIGLVWGTVRLWRMGHSSALGMVIFLLTLAPAFALPYGNFNLLAERYLYLPSLGFCWLVGWRLSKLFDSVGLKPGVAVAAALLFSYAARTEARNFDWRSEIAFYEKSIILAPDLAELHLLLGEAFLRRDRYPEALAETQSAALLKPDYPEAANNLGQIYEQLDQPAKAAVQYARAVQFAEREGLPYATARAYNNLAYELNRLGRTAEAIQMYRKAIATSPEFSGAYNNLGYLFLLQGQYAEAETNLTRALQLEPTFHQAAANLGLLYLRTGKLDLAMSFLNDALRMEPRAGETYARMAEVMEARGDREQAMSLFRRALELHPQNQRATAGIARLQEQKRNTEAH